MIRLPETDFVLRLALIDGMGETKKTKSGFSADWLIGGVLGKFGEILDRITGRGWNPSSSLAASKLTEKLKFLLDEESKTHNGGRFVPHIITLKIQWNKFSSESEDEIDKLENELHAAAIDHINDRLYHTFAPIKIDVKTDYFTEGVRLIGSFGEFGDEDDEAAINVTVPNITIDQISEGTRASIHLDAVPANVSAVPTFVISYTVRGKDFRSELNHSLQKRYSVGRAKDNDITVNDQSVSKVHASLVVKDDGRLLVADTGSTNGTFVAEDRIPYGKAVEVRPESDLKFGTVKIDVERSEIPMPSEAVGEAKPVEVVAPESKPPPTIAHTEASSATDDAIKPEAAEPTVSFSDVAPKNAEEVKATPDFPETSENEAWAMTDHAVKPIVSENEAPVPEASDRTGQNSVAAQPPSETVASINPDSIASDTSNENWSEFGEEDVAPKPTKSSSTATDTDDWAGFSATSNAKPVENNDSEIGALKPDNDSDEWADFAKSESDSEFKDNPDVKKSDNKSKEDWEI